MQINFLFQLFWMMYWMRYVEQKIGKEICDVDGFDNIVMFMLDLNEFLVENGINKMFGIFYNYIVEQLGLKKFRDLNLDKNQKEDEGENNG